MLPVRPTVNKDLAGKILDQTVHDPAYRWVPVAPLPHPALAGDKPDWNRAFPTPTLDIPSKQDLELLVDWYMRAGLWDFAFLVVYAAYSGTFSAPRSMMDTIWDGSPGLSRLWMVRGQTMRPLPRTGPIRQAVSVWWTLSGGYLNQKRQYLSVSSSEFMAHLESVDSPAVHIMPFGSDDPSFITERILTATAGPDLAYPTRTRNLPFPMGAGITEQHGASWRDGVPVDWTSSSQYEPKTLSGQFVKTCPWGLDWLDGARDTIPERIYARARSLRDAGFYS